MSNLDLPIAANNSSAYLASNEADLKVDNSGNRYKSVAMSDADYELTPDDQQNAGFVEFTGTLTEQRNIDMLATKMRKMTFKNSTLGGFDLVVRYAAGGATVTIPNGEERGIQATGSNVIPDGGGSGGGGGTLQAVLANGGEMILIEEKALSGGSSSIFYDPTAWGEIVYKIIYADMSADDDMILRASTDGSTFDVGDSSYGWSYNVISANPTPPNSVNGDNADSGISLVQGTGGTGANENQSFTITIPDPSAATYKQFYYLGVIVDAAGTSYVAKGHGRYIASTAPINGLELSTAGAATFSGGTIQLWGRPKKPTSGYAVDQTTDGNYIDLYSLPLATGEGGSLQAHVLGKRSDNAQQYSCCFINSALNIAGTINAASEVKVAEQKIGALAGNVNATIVGDDTAKTLKIQVRGAAGETWNWIMFTSIVKQ